MSDLNDKTRNKLTSHEDNNHHCHIIIFSFSLSSCWKICTTKKKPNKKTKNGTHSSKHNRTAQLHTGTTATLKAHFAFVGQVLDSSCRETSCHLRANETPNMETLLETHQVMEVHKRWAPLTDTHLTHTRIMHTRRRTILQLPVTSHSLIAFIP